MLETFSTLGVVPVTSHITIDSPIPLSGGLGSSATCVVAGVIAAIELAGRSYDRDLALDVATGIEGHPDNVAPAILGGLVNSFVKDGRCVSTAFSVDPTLRLVAVAPPYEVRTDDARRVIPAEVPVPTAVWQMGRAVASVHAFVTGDMALLSAACDDRLHEPYRKPLIPDYDALRQASVAAGASAFFISGSGSTCIAACASEQVAASVEEAIHEVRPTFWTHVCAADPQGAHLV
jgi:homoserine kinase